MHRRIFVLLCLAGLVLGGCRKRGTDLHAKMDVCGLLEKEEIATVQGAAVKEATGSETSVDGLLIAQCFYAGTKPGSSVSLSVRLSDPHSDSKRSPRDFWKETFGRYESGEEELKGEIEKRRSLSKQKGGEVEEAAAPEKVNGVGESAFWVGDRVGGSLYVLKNNIIVRVSVGGADSTETKIEKSKRLASKALSRL